MNDAFISDRIEELARKLHLAKRNDCRPFGIESHQWRLNPPIEECQVAEFERHHRIELPSEYRAFIARIGDGGAGPAYGMYSLNDALTKEKSSQVPNDFLRTPFPHIGSWNPYHF